MTDREIEPEGYKLTDTTEKEALLSIAISLKRIADALNYAPGQPENLYDIINDIRHNTMPTAR